MTNEGSYQSKNTPVNETAIPARNVIAHESKINEFPASFKIDQTENGFIFKRNTKEYCLQVNENESDTLSVLINLDPKAPVDQINGSVQKTGNGLPRTRTIHNTLIVNKFPAFFKVTQIEGEQQKFKFDYNQETHFVQVTDIESFDTLSVLINLDPKAPVDQAVSEASTRFPLLGYLICPKRNSKTSPINEAEKAEAKKSGEDKIAAFKKELLEAQDLKLLTAEEVATKLAQTRKQTLPVQTQTAGIHCGRFCTACVANNAIISNNNK
jgi:hypothetical protein